MRKKSKLVNLPNGAPFVIESLKDIFTCLYLVRGGDSTCKVQGYKKTDSGDYTLFSDSFGPATEVVYDASRPLLKPNEKGFINIPKSLAPQKKDKEEQQDKEEKEKKTKKALKVAADFMEKTQDKSAKPLKRGFGRPKKHSIVLPKGEEFTVSQLAEKLGVKKFVVNNELYKIKKSNPENVQIVGSISQGKGKAAKIFKLI